MAVGSDADICIWDDQYETTIDNGGLHHAVDYTPCQGMGIMGWPAITLLRGKSLRNTSRSAGLRATAAMFPPTSASRPGRQ
ncbi:hypothetical protein [Nordella sp. HKS 07]|uniref:hypothetical protein n=1 Tax=Nordella sp. HKS 07 TaxID=2712222 RepID=UPI00352C311D